MARLALVGCPLLLLACSPQDLAILRDTGSPPPLDSPAPRDSAPPSRDTAGPEDVGGFAGDWLDGLCQLELDCDEDLSWEQRRTCTLQVVGHDSTRFWDGPVEVWIRGRSSRQVAKHQYAVELQGDGGDDADRDLLGMGDESDWVLQGNYYDRSLVRNKLGYDLFQSFGGTERYAAESGFCELNLNGEYQGVYTLMERIKRDADRVDIQASASGASWVMKKDTEDCFHATALAEAVCWKLIYPNEDDLTVEQAEGLIGNLDHWAEVALGDDPLDPESGLFTVVDMDSAVDVVLLEEFFKNEDFCGTSLHSWRDVDGHIHFAPWDLDMTLGQLWYYQTYGDSRLWINYRSLELATMVQSPDFQASLVGRWAELRQEQLTEDAIFARIDAYQAIMGDAIERNWARWDITTVNYGGYFYTVDSYAEEDAWIREWIPQRLAWMDANIDRYAEHN